MRIKTLSLHNFRNFGEVHEVEFPRDARLLIAVAPNATGKTNFIEAIIVLLRGKSFRASHEDCVQWGEESFLLQGSVMRHNTASRLAIQYHIPSRKLRIEENNTPVSPVTFYPYYPLVLFLPEDTFLCTRGPALRRNFLNTTLTGSSQYISNIVQYHRALRQRNAALKSARGKSDIAVWTELLTTHASSVWTARQAFVAYIQSHLDELYTQVSGEECTFDVQLVPGASDPHNFPMLLEEAWSYERRYRYTLYGPHRDDVRISAGGRPVVSAFSRGQLRSLVIALKIAAWHYIKQTSHQQPLLLFDEVLSELDGKRQRALLKHLPHAQTILTSTVVPDEIKQQEGVHMLDLGNIVRGSRIRRPPGDTREDRVKVIEERHKEQVITSS